MTKRLMCTTLVIQIQLGLRCKQSVTQRSGCELDTDKKRRKMVGKIFFEKTCTKPSGNFYTQASKSARDHLIKYGGLEEHGTRQSIERVQLH